jgi:1-acyl-sn-glycerol-3-phosphate acyltransferase
MKRRFHRAPRLAVKPGRAMSWLALRLMRLFGWSIEGEVPAVPKWIGLGVYHTSNWDFLVMLGAAFYFRIRAYWIGKETLFRKPFGTLMRWLGGIPIRRDKSYNAVQQVVDEIGRHEKIIIIVAPEGTRNHVDHWKSGFYYMALNANIPIVLSYINYKRKAVGLGPLLYPTGDIEADFAKMREFYAANGAGRFPEKQGEIRVREKPASES